MLLSVAGAKKVTQVVQTVAVLRDRHAESPFREPMRIHIDPKDFVPSLSLYLRLLQYL